MVGTVSAQALVEPHSTYVEPISLAIDGDVLIAELPNIGTCGTNQLEIETRLIDQVLQVNLGWEPHAFEFPCLSRCLAGEQVLCTNFVEFTLDPAPPPGTKPVAAGRPLTGLLRAPFRWLLFGALVGGAIGKAGDAAFVQRRRDEELTGSAP